MSQACAEAGQPRRQVTKAVNFARSQKKLKYRLRAAAVLRAMAASQGESIAAIGQVKHLACYFVWIGATDGV